MPPTVPLQLLTRAVQQTLGGPLRLPSTRETLHTFFRSSSSSVTKPDPQPNGQATTVPIPEITDVYPHLETHDSIHRFSLEQVRVGEIICVHHLHVVMRVDTRITINHWFSCDLGGCVCTWSNRWNGNGVMTDFHWWRRVFRVGRVWGGPDIHHRQSVNTSGLGSPATWTSFPCVCVYLF